MKKHPSIGLQDCRFECDMHIYIIIYIELSHFIMHYIPVRFITLQCIITISLSHRSVSFQDIMYDYIMNYTCNICQRIPSVSRWAQIQIPLAKKDGLEIEMIESGVATPSFLYRVGYMMLQPSISYVRIWDSHDSFSSCWIPKSLIKSLLIQEKIIISTISNHLVPRQKHRSLEVSFHSFQRPCRLGDGFITSR